MQFITEKRHLQRRFATYPMFQQDVLLIIAQRSALLIDSSSAAVSTLTTGNRISLLGFIISATLLIPQYSVLNLATAVDSRG